MMSKTVIKSDKDLINFNFKEIVQYKDLIFLLVKRNFAAQYKQTILGPLWFVINPIITTVLYTIVFGGIAGFGENDIPQFAFYLTGTCIWQYFATCVNSTSNTFVANAGILGKVYFPRLIMPISTVIFSAINFLVVFVCSLITNTYYMVLGYGISFGVQFFLVPLLVLQTALLGLGIGIIISALTTKYRDLQILVSFGVNLWMYITPVVYSLNNIPDSLKKYIMYNPMSPILINFRSAMLGNNSIEFHYWIISLITTFLVLFIGILLFNRVEKTFMDTV